jgi:hypothetical protein
MLASHFEPGRHVGELDELRRREGTFFNPPPGRSLVQPVKSGNSALGVT